MEKALEEFGVVGDAMDIPGLDFYKEDISGIGVVVKKSVHGKWIAHDILALVDRGVIQRDTFRFILVSDDLPDCAKLISPED
ncbi:hypothetical protein [Pseudomonas sp. BMS12]|uniref:hypothetical protein n=1 Tax=Pseudomonas sp. BMS12 TaxID=1796033 RepID=UPI00128FED8A|nr:hypothetical protein [Pseudomonas sp. BMS12]